MCTDFTNNTKKIIVEFLQSADGDNFDICHVLYKIMCASDITQQDVLFQHACELFGTIKSNKQTLVPVSDYSTQKEKLREQYGDLVDSIIKTLCLQNAEESFFYHTMWSIINDSIIFDTEAKKVFALYYVLIDKRIPYFRIEDNLLYSMSNDRFSALQKETIHERQRIRFLLKAEMSQKTERAAVLLHELGIVIPNSDNNANVDEYEKRLMQMVYILQELDTSR